MTGGLVFVPHHPMIGTDYHGSIVKKVNEKIETKSNGRIKQSLEIHLRNGSIFTESRWLVRQDLIDREEAEQKRQAELSLKKVVSPVSAPAVTPLEKKKAGEKAHRSAAIDGESSIPTSDVKLKLVDVAGGSSSSRDTPHKDRQTSLPATPSEQESASLHGGGINATSISHKNSSTGTRRQSESKESQHEIQEIVPSSSSASMTTRETNIKSTNKKPKSFNMEQEFGRSKETISGSSGHRKIPPSEKNLMPQLSSPSVTVRKTKSSSAPSTPESKSSRPAKVPLGNNSGHKKIVETHQRLSALLRKPFSPKKPQSANGDLIQSTGSPKESSSLRSLSSETLTSKKVVKPRKTTIVESDHEIIPVARAQAEDNKLVVKHCSSPMTKLETSDGDGCTDLPPSRNISVEDKKPMARTNQVRKTGETTAIDSICELPTNDDSPSDTSSSLATVNQQICNEEIIGEAVTEVTRKVYGFTSGDSSKQKEPKSYADKEMVQETQPDVRSNTSLVVSSEKTPNLISKDEDDSNDDKLKKVKKAKKNSKKSIDNLSIGSIMANPETSVSTKKKKKKKEIEDVLPQKKGVKGNGKKKLSVDSALKDQETENKLGKRTTDILQANISDSDNDEGSHCRLEDVDRDSTTIATRIGPYDSPMASQTPPSMQSLVEGSHDEIAPPPPIATKSKAKLQHAIKSVDPHPGFAKIMGIWGARESKAKDAIPFSPLKPESKVDDPVRGEDIEGSVRNGRVKLCNVFNRSLEADPKFQPPIFEKTEKDRDLIRQSFEVNFAFSDLTPSELEPMVDAFEKVEYQKGETIAQQGEPDCFFYLVQNGEVSFNIDGERVSTGKTGDIFGELALVYSCDRASAVKAEEDQTALLRLHQTNYRHIRRDQVARSVSDRMKLLTKVPFFKEADEADLIQLSTAMVAHVFKAQDNLTATFKEAPFCLIQEGSVTSSSNGSDYGPGGSFGEENLSGKVSGVSNVVALTDGVAYTIDRLSFEKVFGDMNRIALKSLDKKVLREVRAVKAARISISQLDKLARQIADKSFKAGENINVINEDMVPSLYLVRKGRIKTVRKNGKEEIISAGGHFGHEYLIVSSKGSRDSTPSHVKAKYTATAIEDSVCGVLTLQECVAVFGSESINTNLDKADYVALEDLTRHRILGEGHFGVVWLVTNRKSRNMDPFALKIQMLDNEEREALNCIKDEISMMRQLHSPFIVKLINTYEEEDSISMLLGLAPGGELFDQIHYQLPNGLWDSGIGEEKGRFYCSVVADTLSFMHIRGYIFRDLKPENVLIDKDGYPLLTDFGFTTHLKKNEKSYTMCGTPNYLPPEIIKNIGHGAPADNWSLGILIYEVVQGENPFYYEGLDQVSLFHAICNEDYYPLPEDKISGDLEDLIDRLLEKNPSKRLGTFREKDIITHPWFAEVDIRKMRRKELQAPWVPAPIRLN